MAVAWGVLFVAVAEREARNTPEPPDPRLRGPSTPGVRAGGRCPADEDSGGELTEIEGAEE